MTKPVITYGKLCKHHPEAMGARNSFKRCVVCSYERKKKWANENKVRLDIKRKQYSIDKKEDNAARSKKWREENPERAFALKKKYRANNAEKIAKQKRLDYLANPAKKHALVAAWNKRNPDKCAATSAKHRSAKLNASVSWGNSFFIQEAYALAKLRNKVCGGKWEVDHIVPLQSKIVCGLHWEGNLRVILKRTNQSKSNRHWPDMPTNADTFTPTLDASGGVFTVT